jgi:hypothetical protein
VNIGAALAGIYLAVWFVMALCIAHGFGYDKGVRETERELLSHPSRKGA